MGDIKRFLAPAGVIVGSIVTIGSFALDAASVAAWGLPFTAYAAGGFAVAIGSVLAIIYAHQREHDKGGYLRRGDTETTPMDASDEADAVATASSSLGALPPGIEFYMSRSEMNTARGSLKDEFKRTYRVWAAWYAGTYAAATEVFAATGKPHQLVVLNPDGLTARGAAETFNRDFDHMIRDIKTTIDKALTAGVEVFLYDGPITPMVIGEPESGNGWVRVELPIPHSGERPNIVVHQREQPELFQELLNGYKALRDNPNNSTYGKGRTVDPIPEGQTIYQRPV